VNHWVGVHAESVVGFKSLRGEWRGDNNAAERALRPVAIGRKNWLFVGSPAAGGRAAILMSLVASFKFNGVEPGRMHVMC